MVPPATELAVAGAHLKSYLRQPRFWPESSPIPLRIALRLGLVIRSFTEPFFDPRGQRLLRSLGGVLVFVPFGWNAPACRPGLPGQGPPISAGSVPASDQRLSEHRAGEDGSI